MPRQPRWRLRQRALNPPACTDRFDHEGPVIVGALREVFTTWAGLPSFGALVGVIAIGTLMIRCFVQQIAREAAQRPPKQC